jgi:FkbM family methyltransferase
MSVIRKIAKRTMSRSLRFALPRPICVPTPLGFRFWVHPEDMVSVAMASGLYERSDAKVFRKLSFEPGTVVDVGANVGFFSLLFSKIYPSCSVQAVEPNPYSAMRMRANLDANEDLSKRITLHECAAGDFDGIARLSCRPGPRGHAWGTVWETVWDKSAEGMVTQDVRLRRLEGFVVPPLRLVKIDVEGYELEVLNGLGGLLAGRPIIVLEVALGYLIQRPGAYQKELELASRSGYQLFVADRGRLVPYELGPAPHVNLWMIPEELAQQGHVGSVSIFTKTRKAS